MAMFLISKYWSRLIYWKPIKWIRFYRILNQAWVIYSKEVFQRKVNGDFKEPLKKLNPFYKILMDSPLASRGNLKKKKWQIPNCVKIVSKMIHVA